MGQSHASHPEFTRRFHGILKPVMSIVGAVAGLIAIICVSELMGWMHWLSRGFSLVILIGLWRTGKGILAKNFHVAAEGVAIAFVAGFLGALIPMTFESDTRTICVLCGTRRLVTKKGFVRGHTDTNVTESIEESPPFETLSSYVDETPLLLWFRKHFPNHSDHIWKPRGIHRVEYASVLGIKFPATVMIGCGRGFYPFLDDASIGRLDVKYADDPEACRMYLRNAGIEFVENHGTRELFVE